MYKLSSRVAHRKEGCSGRRGEFLGPTASWPALCLPAPAEDWASAGPAGRLSDAAAVTSSGGKEKSGKQKSEKDAKIPGFSSVVLVSPALPHLPAPLW